MRAARFRLAAEMVELWGALDLPARVAPYALRDARLVYIEGYAGVLVSGDLSYGEHVCAAEAGWGSGWREKLQAARQRADDRTPADQDSAAREEN